MTTFEAVQKQLASLYRGEIEEAAAIRRPVGTAGKNDLADFIVDTFNRGWITHGNMGIDDDGNVI